MANALTFLNRVPIAPAMSVMFGAAAATVVAWVPQPAFEHAVASTGLSAVLSIAKMPLGLKARLLAMCLAAAIAALLALVAGLVIERMIGSPKRPKRERHDDEFDLAPYALPPRPIIARAPIYADRDLGAPLMSDEALATAGPLFTQEEAIVPAVPGFNPAPMVEVHDELPDTDRTDLPPLDAPLAFEEFDVVTPQGSFHPSEGETSIEALIRRLEAGLARRDQPQPPTPTPAPPTTPSLGERLALHAVPNMPIDAAASRALDSLRRMAAR